MASRWDDLKELTRLRLNTMVVVTTGVGFLLAAGHPFPWWLFTHAVLGTTLVALGSSVLNQVLERDADSLMRRTADRPIPAGRIGVDQALGLGVVLSVGGLLYLAFAVNLLTSFLGALTLAIYLFLYTPLKRHSSLATVVGAIPGALPPMMGWTAARDGIDLFAWVLFGILFLWQMPHFLAIAWLYRNDYERGGLPMLTVLDRQGGITARQMVLYCGALLPVSLLPAVLGFHGLLYFLSALVLGIGYLGFSFAFARSYSVRDARRLMLASVLYLPALLVAMVVDRVWLV
jgi:heme o synthase